MKTLIMMGALAAGLVIAQSSHAQETTKGNVMTYGYGNQSCGMWVNARDEQKAGRVSPQAELMMAWVEGYISAYEDAESYRHTFKVTDSDGIEVAIDQYCHRHPTNTLRVAANTLFGELVLQAQ